MMKKQFLLASAMSVAFALSGCGGGGGDVLQAAQGDLVVPIGTTNGDNVVAATRGEAFTFANGVPDFGTTASTTVTFAGPDPSAPPLTTGGQTNNSFTVSSGGATATGQLGFGSCIFLVQQSSFTVGLLRPEARIVVNPCNLRVNTAGLLADGIARSRIINLVLNTVTSAGVTAQVAVDGNGTVTVNSSPVGSVLVAPATGVTGS